MSANDLQEDLADSDIFPTKSSTSRWRYLFFFSASLSALLSMLIIGVCAYALASTVAPMPLVIGEVYATALVIALIGLFLCAACVAAVGFSHRGCSVCFLLFWLLFSVMELVFFIYLHLYLKDDTSVPFFSAVIAAQRARARENLLNTAKENPLAWRITQDFFECCGVDFAAGCNGNSTDFTFAESVLETGGVCAPQRSNLASNRTAFCGSEAEVLGVTTFNVDFNAKALFFCEDVFEEEMAVASLGVASVTFALVFVTYISALGAIKLMYIPVERRGLLVRSYGRYPSSDTESEFTMQDAALREAQARDQLARAVARRLRESGQELARIRGNIRKRFGTLGEGLKRTLTRSSTETDRDSLERGEEAREERGEATARGSDEFEYDIRERGVRRARDSFDEEAEFEEHIASPVQPRNSPSMYERFKRGFQGRRRHRAEGETGEQQQEASRK